MGNIFRSIVNMIRRAGRWYWGQTAGNYQAGKKGQATLALFLGLCTCCLCTVFAVPTQENPQEDLAVPTAEIAMGLVAEPEDSEAVEPTATRNRVESTDPTIAATRTRAPATATRPVSTTTAELDEPTATVIPASATSVPASATSAPVVPTEVPVPTATNPPPVATDIPVPTATSAPPPPTEAPAPTATIAPPPTDVPPTAVPIPPTEAPAPTEPPVVTGGQVVISFIFYNGVVPDVESDEYAVITNNGGTPVNMSGWRLNAGADGQDYYFPSIEIPAGGSCRVYTNEIHPETCGLSFQVNQAYWRNSGDCGYLFDTTGAVVSEYCF